MRKVGIGAAAFRVMRGAFLLLLWVFGLILIVQGVTGLQLGRTRVTPMAELAAHAGSYAKIRVEGRAVEDALVTTGDGRKLAFQQLEIMHGVGSAADSTFVVDYFGQSPSLLRLSDGTGVVEVDPRGLNEAFLPEPARQGTTREGALPAAFRQRLAPGLQNVPRAPDATVSLWEIGAGEPITVYGLVDERDGRLVLHAEEGRDDLFVVSPLPFEKIVGTARGESIACLVWGGLLVAGVPAWLLWRGRAGRAARRRR